MLEWWRSIRKDFRGSSDKHVIDHSSEECYAKWLEHITCSDYWVAVWKGMTNHRHFEGMNHPVSKWFWLHGYDIHSDDDIRKAYHHLVDLQTGGIQPHRLCEFQLIDSILTTDIIKRGNTFLSNELYRYLSDPAVERKFFAAFPKCRGKGYIADIIGGLRLRSWTSIPRQRKSVYLYCLAIQNDFDSNNSIHTKIELMYRELEAHYQDQTGDSKMLVCEQTTEERSVLVSIKDGKWVIYHKGVHWPVSLGGEPTNLDYLSMPFYKFEGPELAKQTAQIGFRDAYGNWLVAECDRNFNIVLVKERTTGNMVKEFYIAKNSTALGLFMIKTTMDSVIK